MLFSKEASAGYLCSSYVYISFMQQTVVGDKLHMWRIQISVVLLPYCFCCYFFQHDLYYFVTNGNCPAGWNCNTGSDTAGQETERRQHRDRMSPTRVYATILHLLSRTLPVPFLCYWDMRKILGRFTVQEDHQNCYFSAVQCATTTRTQLYQTSRTVPKS